MSQEILDGPTINIPETRSSEEDDDDDSFDRKLEEMKADLEDLENDFSTQTLDALVKKNYSVPAVRVNHGHPEDLGKVLEKEGAAPANIGKDLGEKRKMSTLSVPDNAKFENDSFRSDQSILFGKEYLNNSQDTIKSGMNSSVLSKNHYAKLDPDGDWLTARSARDADDASGFDLDKDTLDLIDPKDIDDRSVKMDKGEISPFMDQEVKLNQEEGVDHEWQRFLKDAQNTPEEEVKIIEEVDTDQKKTDYYRNLVTKDIMLLTEKKQDAIAPTFYAQTVNENQMISEKDIDHVNFNKNICEILNIETVLLVLSRRTLHVNLTSDLEIVRWKKFLIKFLKKNGTNHEALFGMSQIHFSMGMNEAALHYWNKAIESSKRKVPIYFSWKWMYYYFLYLKYKLHNIKSRRVPAYFLSWESSWVEALVFLPESIALHYLMLILSCDRHQLNKHHQSMANSNLKAPASYAATIKKINKYMGYMSWAEIYLRDKTKKALGNDVLNDLMSEYPKHPLAFLRKWRKDYDTEQYLDSLEPMEELFLKEEEMYSIPEMKVIVALLYAKSLVKTNQYVLACELIQNEFYKKTTHAVFLFYYGKYAMQSPLSNLHWAAIGIFKECLNSCVSHRSALIYFFLGQAYQKTRQPLKALKYFEKAKSAFKKNKAKDETHSLYDYELEEMEKVEHKFHKLQSYEFVIKKKAKEVEYYLKKRKQRPKISEKEKNSLIQRANAIYKHDPYNASLLKVLVCWDICQDKRATVAAFEEGIKKTPHNINVFIEYWKFLKYLKKKDKMIEISERMIAVADEPTVPSDQWADAYDIRFKSLLSQGSSEEIIKKAVNSLKKICYILPPLPLDGLWYIQEAESENNEEETDDTGNKEIQEIYEKSQNLLNPQPSTSLGLKRAATLSSGIFLSLKDRKSHLPASREDVLNKIRKRLRGSSTSSLNSRDGGIRGIRKKDTEEEEKFSDTSSSSNYEEYENILRVTFKSDFLYQIGKVWSKSGFMLEKALKYLNDFLLIINFYKQDMETKSYNKLRCHAIYYIGIAYFQIGDKEYAEKFLREIQTEMIETEGKDSKKVKKIESILAKYFSERFNPITSCISGYF